MQGALASCLAILTHDVMLLVQTASGKNPLQL